MYAVWRADARARQSPPRKGGSARPAFPEASTGSAGDASPMLLTPRARVRYVEGMVEERTCLLCDSPARRSQQGEDINYYRWDCSGDACGRWEASKRAEVELSLRSADQRRALAERARKAKAAGTVFRIR